MRPILTAFCLMLPFAGPAAAEPLGAERWDDAGREIVEGLERFRDGLAQLLEEIPRFAPPEFTEEGDIILRRTNPPGARPPSEDGTVPPPLAGKRAVEI